MANFIIYLKMTIHRVTETDTALITRLTTLWEASVRASHHFLTEEDIYEIKTYVPQVLTSVEHLIVAYDSAMQPTAFLGVDNSRIEMLFVAPESFGQGIGRALISYARDTYQATQVTVNEQNPAAVGFYEHLGFKTVKRTDHDEQGRPFPLLYMEL